MHVHDKDMNKRERYTALVVIKFNGDCTKYDVS